MTAAALLELPAPPSPPSLPGGGASTPRPLRQRTEAELTAQVLGGAAPAAEVLRCAEQLARLPFWERRALDVPALVHEHGVPEAHALRLVALWELADRWFPDDRPAVTSPREAVLLLSPLAATEVETVMVLLLDGRYRVLGVETVAVGGVNVARLQPRDVFTPAVRASAAAVVIAHSHPSGDPTPSRADRVITMALREAAAIIGVPLLDHLVVTGHGFHSFARDECWTDSPAWTTDDSGSIY
jgi:DNA repair protein RadC